MKILIATGGTGGHIFPAIETAKVLKTRGHTVSFAGVLGLASDKIASLGFPLHSLSAHGLDDSSWKTRLNFATVMSRAVFRSFDVVRKVMPDKIIGFGSYGAFPVVMAGVLRRRPTMIHEQNVVPGKANIVLSKFVKKVAISFKDSRPYFNRRKTVWTGCPCNQYGEMDRSQALALFNLQGDKKTLLMLGGSQGSQKLNEVFFNMIQDLSTDFQAIHMTGPKEYPLYQERYRQINRAVRVYPFIERIAQAYAAADIVIARAGAATVTELGSLGIPSILVPYPYAGHHQKYNANVLSACGAAIMIEQKNLTSNSLLQAVGRLMASNTSREGLKEKTGDLFHKDSALQLALVLEGL